MRLKIKINLSVSIFIALIFPFSISQNALADSQWENLLEQDKLKQGVAAAVTTAVPVDEISKKAVELNYPACDILVAELKAKIDAYLALKTIIAAGGDLEHLALCCPEPGVQISSAVFAKAALDAGVEEKAVDHFLRIAFTPPPQESGIFKKEPVVAGGEIREGPFASPDSPE